MPMRTASRIYVNDPTDDDDGMPCGGRMGLPVNVSAHA